MFGKIGMVEQTEEGDRMSRGVRVERVTAVTTMEWGTVVNYFSATFTSECQ